MTVEKKETIKRKRGRPAQTDAEITDATKQQIVNWVRENGLQRYGGAAIRTLADYFNISTTAFYFHRQNDEKFASDILDAIEEFKEKIEPTLVKSLFNAARGYEYVQETEEVKYDKFGAVQGTTRKRKKMHVEPNINAGIFILTNLYPDRWKSKQTQEFTASTDEDKCIQVEVVGTEKPQLTAEEKAIVEDVKAIEVKQ